MPIPTNKTEAEKLIQDHFDWFYDQVNLVIANNVRAGSPAVPPQMLQQQLDALRSGSHTTLNALFFDEK